MNEYSKGGNVIERRYVNKDEDYEVRYVKDKPSRMGYKDERMFEGGGEMGKKLKGYRVYVFESSLSSSDNALKGDSYVLVTDGIKGDSSEVDSDDVYLKLVKRHLFGKDILHAEPININKRGNQMFGGKFVWSTDSRFREDISEQPIQLHDRFESYALGGGIEQEVPLRAYIDGYIYEVIGVNHKLNKVRAKNFSSGKVIEMPINKWIIESFERGTPASFMLNGREVSGEVVIRNGQESICLYRDNNYAGDAERIIPMREIDIATLKPFMKKEKFAVGGEIGNTVSFKGDYGTPRSGVVKEKRGSSYIVGTDDGDRLVDSYEVISFSETPIAKKKRFGFFEGGGEIENKIEKLKKVVSSKMLPESVKAKAQAEIDKLEKQLHESKETKAEEKEEHEDFDKSKSELVKSKHKGEKEISFIKSEKVTEIENGKESENFFKAGEAIYGTIVSENSKQYLVKSSNNKDIEYLVNKDAVKLISVKAPSKPTTRKSPVKAKEKAKKFKVGETVSIIDHPKSDKTNFYKVVGHQDWNDDYGWETTIEKAGEKVTMFENLLEKSIAPKPDHKKLLAKIKAKKGDKEYDNRASLVPFTDKRRERSESSDKKRSALPPGKRVSENGVTYYESRLNRTDLSKKDKFEDGGEVKGSGWGLNLNW
jgi:hypothetical protein